MLIVWSPPGAPGPPAVAPVEGVFRTGGQRREIIVRVQANPMAGVFQNIDPHPPHRPASVYPPPLVRGEDTLTGWREGGGGLIFWKTSDTAPYSTYVSTLWWAALIACEFHNLPPPSRRILKLKACCHR
jgi:hypothetical protein